MFGTTRRFLEVFGLDRLEDMPSLKEFDGLDESKLPTILRQKIPPELFDEEASEEQRLKMRQQTLNRLPMSRFPRPTRLLNILRASLMKQMMRADT